jgi:hypothetical protein
MQSSKTNSKHIPSSPRHHQLSQIGPKAGTPLLSNPPTTHFTTFSLLSTNTASYFSLRYILHATANKSGLPIPSVSIITASGSALYTNFIISAPYVASGARVDHTKRANWDAGRSSSEESEGPMPDPVVRIRTRGKRMERESTPALGWDFIQKRIWIS